MFLWKTCLSQKKHIDIFSAKKWCLPAVPKRIRSLIKPLLKNSCSTKFQGTGPWEGPVHFSRSLCLSLPLPLSLFLFLFLFFFRFLFLLLLFLFLFLFLSLSLSLSLSFSFSRSLSLFFIYLITCFIEKKLKVEKVTQSTCWTPLTTSTTSTTSTTNTRSSWAKRKFKLDFNCSQWKSLLKCRLFLLPGTAFCVQLQREYS